MFQCTAALSYAALACEPGRPAAAAAAAANRDDSSNRASDHPSFDKIAACSSEFRNGVPRAKFSQQVLLVLIQHLRRERIRENGSIDCTALRRAQHAWARHDGRWAATRCGTASRVATRATTRKRTPQKTSLLCAAEDMSYAALDGERYCFRSPLPEFAWAEDVPRADGFCGKVLAGS